MLRADLAAAGLPRVGIHDLRHSFASMLIAEGVSIPAIAKLLGHSSPRMVMEVYGHVVKELEVDAIDRLDRALG